MWARTATGSITEKAAEFGQWSRFRNANLKVDFSRKFTVTQKETRTVHVPPTVPPSPDWQLRIRSPEGMTAGAGVLVSPRHVLTCAHVVCDALEIPWEEEATPCPSGPVLVDAPRGGDSWRATATVLDDGWFTSRSPWDIAVLFLDRGAPARPARLRHCGEVDRSVRPVSMVGFSHDGIPTGIWAYGRLGGRGGRHYEHVQIDIRYSTGVRVASGFSGSGVRENRSGELIGVVCYAHSDERGFGVSSWMIPVEEIPNVWHGETGSSLPPQPERPRMLNELAGALTEVSTIADPEARRELCALYDPRIRSRVRIDLSPRLFAFQLIRVAQEYGQLDEVLAVLDMIEEGSLPMRRAWESAETLLDR